MQTSQDVLGGVAVAGGYLSKAQVGEAERVTRTVRSDAGLVLSLVDIAVRKEWLSEGRARELAIVAKVVHFVQELRLDEPLLDGAPASVPASSALPMTRAGVVPAEGGDAKSPTLSVDGLCTQLGALPPGTLVTAKALAAMFGKHKRAVERAVGRGELPTPTKMMGRSTWTVGAILTHVEKRLKEAARATERRRRQIEKHLP